MYKILSKDAETEYTNHPQVPSYEHALYFFQHLKKKKRKAPIPKKQLGDYVPRGLIISRVHLEHTAETTGLMQQIECFVDLFESQIMGDVFIDLDFLLNE